MESIQIKDKDTGTAAGKAISPPFPQTPRTNFAQKHHLSPLLNALCPRPLRRPFSYHISDHSPALLLARCRTLQPRHDDKAISVPYQSHADPNEHIGIGRLGEI